MASKRGNRRQFGRVRQLPSGRWQARYPGPDGKLHPADRTFATKKDAGLWLDKKRVEIEEGRWLDPDAGKATVQDWAERWLASISPQLKPKTRSLYRGLIRSRIVPTFGARTLVELRPIAVAEWIAAMQDEGLSASRVRQAYRVLSQVMRAAVDNGLISTTPCRGVRLPRLPDTEPHILTPLEAARIVGSAEPPHDALIAVLVFAGLRIGEAFALRRGDVDASAGLLVVDENLADVNGKLHFVAPKTHQKRVLTLPPSLMKRLTRHLAAIPGDADALLFTDPDGKPLRYKTWRRQHFDPAVKSAGLTDVTPHDLRASHGSWVADKHGVMTAAHRLGHSNGSVTTRHYARPVPGRDAEVAEAMDAWMPEDDQRARGGHGTGEEPDDGASEAV